MIRVFVVHQGSYRTLSHILFALSFLLLSVNAGTSAVAQGPVHQNSPAFEVAVVKPTKPNDNSHNWNGTRDSVSIENYTLRQLIRSAYELKADAQILGGPDWISRQAFDIQAKIDDVEIEKMRAMDSLNRQHERNQMLQSLLADRFQLKVHLESRVMPVYALVQTKSGAKLKAVPEDTGAGHGLNIHNGHMIASAISMDLLAEELSREPETAGRMVLNRTGLSGLFAFKLDWAEDFGSGVPDGSVLPGLFTALQEQLGLKLDSRRESVRVIVVESATKPTID